MRRDRADAHARGESHLVVRSSLRFTTLTAAQHAALTDTLHYLATALQPIA